MEKIAILIFFIAIVLVSSAQAQDGLTSAVTKIDDIDLYIDLFPLSRELKTGEDVRTSIRIDTHTDELVDVVLSYTITNNKGLVVFQKSKTLAVQRTAQVTDNLMIHKSLGPGSYLVDIEVSYNHFTKKERETFNVAAEPSEARLSQMDSIMLLILIILLIAFIALLWIHNRRVNKMIKEHEKLDIEHIMKL